MVRTDQDFPLKKGAEMGPHKLKVQSRYFLLVIIFAASVLRLYNLGMQSFWVDEINAYYAAQSLNSGQGLNLLSGFPYGRAPFYTYCVAAVSKITGPGETATRLPSAFFGILGVLAIYLVASKMFDKKTGLVAAAIAAFSNFEVGWSRTAKMYTLLQLFTVSSAYFFLLGFEPKRDSKRYILPALEKKWDISFLWLFVAGVVSAYSYLRIHQLTAVFITGLFAYIFCIAVFKVILSQGRERILNKYFITSMLLIIFTGIAVAAVPWVRTTLRYFLDYTPEWARGAVSARYRFIIPDFIVSAYRFPLGFLFLAGSIIAVFKGNRKGVFSFIVFTFSVFMLTFVFTHRVPAYIFSVYPFFIILSAYFTVWFVEEIKQDSLSRINNSAVMFKKVVSVFIYVSITLLFLISPWIRITLNIPKTEDGKTNMAVTPGEWRDAGRYLSENLKKDDLVISNLPQISSYYLPATNYTLNFSLLDQAKTFKDAFKDGRWVDVYAGVPCIENLNDLIDIVKTKERTWLVLEKYLFDTDAYPPAEIRDHIKNNFKLIYVTKNRSIIIYYVQSPGE